MLIWGLVLAAIGIGALMDWKIWPVALVTFGVAMVFAAVSGLARKYPEWFWCGCGGYPQRRQ